MSVFEVEDRLGEIRMPTLIVPGRLDPTVPIAHSARLRAGIPRAEFVVLEEGGHGAEPESADGAKYRAAVRRFLGKVAT